MNNKDLKMCFVYLAIGEPAVACFRESIKSLLEAGYTSDIHLLTDSEELEAEFSQSRNPHIHRISSSHLNYDPKEGDSLALFDIRRIDKSNFRNERNPKKWTICRAKTLMDYYIDINKYDYVIYLDVDVVANRISQSEEKLKNYLKSNLDKIVIASGPSRILGGRGNFSFRKLQRVRTATSANLTNIELFKYWFKPSICSDVVCIPKNKYKLIEEWRDECNKNLDYDQPALQAILLRKYSQEYLIAGKEVFGLGTILAEFNKGILKCNKTSLLVHLQGAVKNTDLMKVYLNKCKI